MDRRSCNVYDLFFYYYRRAQSTNSRCPIFYSTSLYLAILAKLALQKGFQLFVGCNEFWSMGCLRYGGVYNGRIGFAPSGHPSVHHDCHGLMRKSRQDFFAISTKNIKEKEKKVGPEPYPFLSFLSSWLGIFPPPLQGPGLTHSHTSASRVCEVDNRRLGMSEARPSGSIPVDV